MLCALAVKHRFTVNPIASRVDGGNTAQIPVSTKDSRVVVMSNVHSARQQYIKQRLTNVVLRVVNTFVIDHVTLNGVILEYSSDKTTLTGRMVTRHTGRFCLEKIENNAA